jgi:uncharacterized protein (TIGR00297 family)
VTLPDPGAVAAGAVVTLLVAAAARSLGAVSGRGTLAGIAVGLAASAAFGAGGLAPVGTFFVLASLATRWRFAEKSRRGIAEPGGGARGAGRVLAKGAVGAALAAAALSGAFAPDLVRAAFAGAFAAAAADTLGTEVGQVLGRRPLTLLPPRTAAPGTPGAISGAGLAAGLAGAIAVGGAAAWGGVVPPGAVPAIAAGGLLGSVVESACAPLLRRLRHPGLAGNLVTTAAGAAAAAAGAALLGPRWSP